MSAKPVRLQLSRKRGFNLQRLSRETNGLEAVKVTRGGEWGNPFRVSKANFLVSAAHPEPKTEWWVENSSSVWRFPTKQEATEAAVKLFRANAESAANERWRQRVRLGLRGKNLACWCPLPKDGEPDVCHAAVLLELAALPATGGGTRTGR